MAKIDVLLHGQPLRTGEGIVGFCSVLLVEGQRSRTLVDVGHVGRRNSLLQALAERHLTPSDIDNVLVTHAHWDHAQNLDVLDDAAILIHPHERRYAQRPHPNDWATPAWSGSMIERQPTIVEVDEGYVIEPGITLMHTPGHSVGSLSVQVETDEGICVVSGDVLHYSSAALTRVNPVVFWDAEQASRSIDRIVDIADVIYPGHDRPFRVVNGAVEYLAPLSLRLMGVDRDEPGVTFDPSPAPRFVMPGIEEQSVPALP